MRGQPTPSLGLLQESRQPRAYPAAIQLLGQKVGLLGLAPWEGSAFLCIVSRKHLALLSSLGTEENSSLVCPIVCAFFSKEFTTPSPFWARGLRAAPRISSEIEREGAGRPLHGQ